MLWSGLLGLVAANAAQERVVVVGDEVRLYAHPGDRAAVLIIESPHHLALSVVSEADGWLEVSTVTTANPACEPLRSRMPGADLHMWIRAEDRAKVLTRSVHIPWPGGGDVVFRAGYRYADLAYSLRTEAWSGLLTTLEAQIPSDAWGFEVTPEPGPSSSGEWRRWVLPEWDRIVVTPSGLTQLPPVLLGEDVATAADLVRITSGCLTMVAYAPNLAATPPMDPPKGAGGLGYGKKQVFEEIQAGATLRWPDGTTAGTAIADFLVRNVRTAGTLRCGWPNLVGVLPEVCVTPPDIVPLPTSTSTAPR